MPNPSTFGQRLKIAREEREWTQAQIAERSGVPAMMISHYETGVRANPSLATLKAIADALNVSIEWLLGRTEDRTPVAGPLAALFRSASQQSGERLEAIKSVLESLTRDTYTSGENKDKGD